MDHNHDIVVLGSGIGGLTFALDAAETVRVALVTKRGLTESNTRWAQGGIAAVLDPQHDSFEQHVEDTLRAGAGLCRRDVVEMVVHAAPEAIERLLQRGVQLDKDGEGHLHLTREGGHSTRRVAHHADSTGEAIELALTERARRHPNIQIYEHHIAVDLITRGRLARGTGRGVPGGKGDQVLGVYVLDLAHRHVIPMACKALCIATGGAGKVYRYTTNPDVATGDGIAMAWRAGARISNMEFFQFHPTCLFHPDAKNFLISEALRGEGGILRNGRGEAFMARYHALKELAPRDIVARAIDSELKQSGEPCVYLDMTHLPAAFLVEHFPTIHARCMSLGIDMREQPIPVVPAAHYLCGGVTVDMDGRASIAGLYAIGEASCTGLHGANRLASNSLLEAAVYGERAARAAVEFVRDGEDVTALRVPDWDTGAAGDADEQVVVTQSWDEIRRLMWNYVGIVRTRRRLLRAQRRLQLIEQEVREDWWRFYLTADLVELRNITQVALLIVEAALARRESRGLHWVSDDPEIDDVHWLRDSMSVRGST
jgi:L-aspartate oxidase